MGLVMHAQEYLSWYKSMFKQTKSKGLSHNHSILHLFKFCSFRLTCVFILNKRRHDTCRFHMRYTVTCQTKYGIDSTVQTFQLYTESINAKAYRLFHQISKRFLPSFACLMHPLFTKAFYQHYCQSAMVWNLKVVC